MNSHSQRNPKPVFFLDHNLGRYAVANALRKAGALIEVHEDHFPQGLEDPNLLQEVGRRGWIFLSKDSRIKYRRSEIMSLKLHKVSAFILITRGKTNLNGQEMADVFVKALNKMCRLVEQTAPPFIAKVTKSGEVHLLDI